MAPALPTTAPSASNPDFWAQLLAESALPQSPLDALAAEPQQATSVHSFCCGMRTREGVDDWCNYILFNVAGPQVVVTGTAGWEQGLDPAHRKFSRWAGCVHRLWDVAKQVLAQYSKAPALDLAMGPGNMGLPPFGFGMQLHQLTGAPSAEMVPQIKRDVRLQLWKDFVAHYPGEVINEHATLGKRWVDRVYNDAGPGYELKCCSWRQRLSVKEERAVRRERDANSQWSEQSLVHRLFPDWD